MINDIGPYLETLAHIERSEAAVGEYYRQCALHWPEAAAFWNAIAAEEDMHVLSVRQMAAMLTAAPQKFRQGRSINPVAIKTFIRGVEEHKSRVAAGELDQKRALFIAIDIEKSLLENRFYEILQADTDEFGKLIARITAETRGHFSRMQAEAVKLGQ